MTKKIVVGSDHAGYEGRQAVLESVKNQPDLEVTDLGTRDKQSTDYPDYAHKVAEEVASGRADFGVLVCSTGQGMAMSANRHAGVRAALITDEMTARLARAHNNANVACFGEKVLGPEKIPKLLEIFLETPFEGDRHVRRVEKIEIR